MILLNLTPFGSGDIEDIYKFLIYFKEILENGDPHDAQNGFTQPSQCASTGGCISLWVTVGELKLKLEKHTMLWGLA